jgi:hypothetical protein
VNGSSYVYFLAMEKYTRGTVGLSEGGSATILVTPNTPEYLYIGFTNLSRDGDLVVVLQLVSDWAR